MLLGTKFVIIHITGTVGRTMLTITGVSTWRVRTSSLANFSSRTSTLSAHPSGSRNGTISGTPDHSQPSFRRDLLPILGLATDVFFCHCFFPLQKILNFIHGLVNNSSGHSALSCRWLPCLESHPVIGLGCSYLWSYRKVSLLSLSLVQGNHQLHNI